MKETSVIYRCDSCNAILSEGGDGKRHLSLTLGKRSGWVEKKIPFSEGIPHEWKHIDPIVEGIKHFCNGKCLANYFEVAE